MAAWLARRASSPLVRQGSRARSRPAPVLAAGLQAWPLAQLPALLLAQLPALLLAELSVSLLAEPSAWLPAELLA